MDKVVVDAIPQILFSRFQAPLFREVRLNVLEREPSISKNLSNGMLSIEISNMEIPIFQEPLEISQILGCFIIKIYQIISKISQFYRIYGREHDSTKLMTKTINSYILMTKGNILES